MQKRPSTGGPEPRSPASGKSPGPGGADACGGAREQPELRHLTQQVLNVREGGDEVENTKLKGLARV